MGILPPRPDRAPELRPRIDTNTLPGRVDLAERVFLNSNPYEHSNMGSKMLEHNEPSEIEPPADKPRVQITLAKNRGKKLTFGGEDRSPEVRIDYGIWNFNNLSLSSNSH